MSDNKTPLLALVETNHTVPAGTPKAALVKAVNAGFPTEGFNYAEYGDMSSFIGALSDGYKFDGAVIFHHDPVLEVSDEKFKEFIFKCVLYGIRRFVVVCNDIPYDDDNLEYFCNFMDEMGLDPELYTHVSCPVYDFVNGDLPSHQTSMMRPLISGINDVIVKPAMQPPADERMVDSFSALILSKIDENKLIADTRASVIIANEDYLSLIRVRHFDEFPTGIYVAANVDMIDTIPYRSGTRFMIKSRYTGKIMGAGTIL